MTLKNPRASQTGSKDSIIEFFPSNLIVLEGLGQLTWKQKTAAGAKQNGWTVWKSKERHFAANSRMRWNDDMLLFAERYEFKNVMEEP